MRTVILGTLAFIACPGPLAAEERLAESIRAGADRICVYRSLLPGIGSARERTVRVGLGEPCPVVPGSPEASAPAIPKIPMLARLEGRAEVAGRTVCVYRFAQQRYTAPAEAGRPCSPAPSGY